MDRLLTRVEKEAIRNSPCGRCGAMPPFADGSRCHPHRIVPGYRGGRYTHENTVPRCPSCHDLEHGGAGFIAACRIGGRRGGKALGERIRQKGLTEKERQQRFAHGQKARARHQQVGLTAAELEARRKGCMAGKIARNKRRREIGLTAAELQQLKELPRPGRPRGIPQSPAARLKMKVAQQVRRARERQELG